jgi:hypothetical protein
MSRYILWSIVGIFVVFIFCNFYTGMDYLQGKSYHYLGTTELHDSQIPELIRSAINDIGITPVKFHESDKTNLTVTYDFYSPKEIIYLEKSEYSFFDTPYIHSLGKTNFSGLLFLFGVIILFSYFLGSANRKAQVVRSNILWGMYHPFVFLKRNRPPQSLYVPVVTGKVNISHDKAGIIGVRAFKYLEKDGYLYSAGAGQSCWNTKTLVSNKKPTEKNSNGCYAFRLVILNEQVFVKLTMAIVSLKGDYCEHADGIIRSEHCEILHLIIDKYYEKYASKLSQYYGVPVTVTDNTLETYSDWLSSENGIQCLKHNTEVLKGSDICQQLKK